MSHGSLRYTIGFGGLVLGLQLGACGDYTADPLPGGAGAGGSAATTAGAPAASGTGTTGGSGGSSGSATAGTGTGGRQDPPAPSCTDVAACGGDVAGVWFATGSCLPISGIANITDFGIGCEEAGASGKLEVTGNWTLGTDGKISDNTTTTGMVVLELQPKCLDVSGTKTICEKLAAPLSSIGFETLTCVDSTTTAGGCTCTGTVKQMGSMAHVSFSASKTGKYMAANNKISVTGAHPGEYDYCVQGEFMQATLKSPNVVGVTNGTVVFQKQP